jgi:hypothetical protein
MSELFAFDHSFGDSAPGTRNLRSWSVPNCDLFIYVMAPVALLSYLYACTALDFEEEKSLEVLARPHLFVHSSRKLC